MRPGGLAATLLLLLFLAGTVLNGSYSRIFPSPIGPTPFGLDDESRYLALRDLQAQGLPGPVFNDYNIGSLVEYNLHPQPAYTDNRPEAFPLAFWQDEYIPALNDLGRWHALLESRNIQTVIVSLTGVKEGFTRMMMHDPRWQLVHLDFFCAVWVRKSVDNAPFLDRHTYTYGDLHAYRDQIARRILALDRQPFWRRQVLANQIVFELYSLICIDQPALAWPLLLQMHLRYPDEQALHELFPACAPPEAEPALFDIRKRAARFPLSAKQVADYAQSCLAHDRPADAARALRKGRLFFPLNPVLRDLAGRVSP